MDQLSGLFRGFDCIDDNPIMLIAIIGLILFLLLGNDNFECFFEQNNFLIWIILIVFILFLFNNNNSDDCCC